MTSRIFRLLPAGLLLACGLAFAQNTPPSTQLAQMGGAMHAAAKVCGDYSEAQLKEMKEKQQQSMKEMGLNEADFEAAFNAGLERGSKDMATISEAQRQQMCEQLRSGPKF
ncbi:hypothetical protein [Alcaligenes sp. Lyrl_28]|jgi:hypothetical protein|uniref:hypothetical protein n=1 Tax=Alcaligenes sp. Lyrl_28 TaxID=3110924 RepID=UPI0026592608|nr:hypothetical protein QEZ63_05085 [Alcaligenes faecalis]